MGRNHRGDLKSHSKHNDSHRSRRPNRTAKIRNPTLRQVRAARSDTESSGCNPASRGTRIPDQTPVKEKSSRAWENIVLHYLSKLKNVWRPSVPVNENELVHPVTPGNREDSATRFRRERHNEHRRLHYKYKLSSPTVSSVPSSFCLTGKRKAFNIVANAIEYGLASGIVSKNGNFFWLSHRLKNNKRLHNRKSPCSKCRSCKDGFVIAPSGTDTTADIEKDHNPAHASAMNKSRPNISKAKSVLPTGNLKIKKVASTKFRSKPRSARSVKSHKSRVGSVTLKRIPKDSIALARLKSKKKSIANMPSTMRDEYVSRLTRAKTKERDCRCFRCLKKYITTW